MADVIDLCLDENDEQLAVALVGPALIQSLRRATGRTHGANASVSSRPTTRLQAAGTASAQAGAEGSPPSMPASLLAASSQRTARWGATPTVPTEPPATGTAPMRARRISREEVLLSLEGLAAHAERHPPKVPKLPGRSSIELVASATLRQPPPPPLTAEQMKALGRDLKLGRSVDALVPAPPLVDLETVVLLASPSRGSPLPVRDRDLVPVEPPSSPVASTSPVTSTRSPTASVPRTGATSPTTSLPSSGGAASLPKASAARPAAQALVGASAVERHTGGDPGPSAVAGSGKGMAGGKSVGAFDDDDDDDIFDMTKTVKMSEEEMGANRVGSPIASGAMGWKRHRDDEYRDLDDLDAVLEPSGGRARHGHGAHGQLVPATSRSTGTVASKGGAGQAPVDDEAWEPPPPPPMSHLSHPGQGLASYHHHHPRVKIIDDIDPSQLRLPSALVDLTEGLPSVGGQGEGDEEGKVGAAKASMDEGEGDGGDKICVRVRGDDRTEWNYRIARDAPMSKIIESVKAKLNLSKVTLLFDDSALQDSDTPDSLGLEDGDMIDVRRGK